MIQTIQKITKALFSTESAAKKKFAILAVGYNADPKACVEIVRSMNAPCVKGNHDQYCATDQPLDEFNPPAAAAITWTRKQLSLADQEWLRTLPYTREVAGFTIVHATFARPDLWTYVFDKIAATQSLDSQDTQLCFFGHTHVPLAFIRDTSVRGGSYSTLKLESRKRYFINPGSVGYPRDMDRRATYAIYDQRERQITLRRIDYDIETTRRKIRDAGLPPGL